MDREEAMVLILGERGVGGAVVPRPDDRETTTEVNSSR
jgi:hypothetical protein